MTNFHHSSTSSLLSPNDPQVSFDRTIHIKIGVLHVHRDSIYLAFGLCCLGGWLAFNLWVLRDYLFPSLFPPIYTENGLSKRKLQKRTKQYVMRSRVSNAFSISASIAIPHSQSMQSNSLLLTPEALNVRRLDEFVV